MNKIAAKSIDRAPILAQLLPSKGRGTINDMGCSLFVATAMEADGLIENTGKVVHTGKRGRPPQVFRLTPKGRGRARRAAAAA